MRPVAGPTRRRPLWRRATTLLTVPALLAGLLVVVVSRSPQAAAGVENLSPTVTAVSRSAGKLDIFGVDTGGRIYTASWEPGFSAWFRRAEINGGIAAPGSSVYGVSRRTDFLDIFAVGTDRKVYTAAWEPSFGSEWRGWWQVGDLTVAANTSVHAISVRRDRIDLFAVGEDLFPYTASWTPRTGWTAWERVGGDKISRNATVFAVSAGPGRIHLLAPLGYYRMVHASSFQPTLPAAERLGGWEYLNRDAPGYTSVYGVSRREGVIDIFSVGEYSFTPITASWSDDTGSWSAWREIGDGFSVAGRQTVFASVRSEDHLDVFVVGSDRKVYTAAWEPAFGDEWHGWWQVGDMTAAERTTVFGVSRDTDHLDIFGVSEDTGTYTAAWEPAFGSEWGGWWEIGRHGQAGDSVMLPIRIELSDREISGWATVQISTGGAYVFSGHLRNHGFYTYDVGVVMAVQASDGEVFTFKETGNVAGTIGSGSRSHDWFKAGVDQRLADHGEAIAGLTDFRWRAAADLDVGRILELTLLGFSGVVRVSEIV